MRRRRNKGRNISGILLLDKHIGITSNAALQEVKQLYHARKAGHTGSLDPLATGLLPLCLGEATKVSTFLLDTDKRYHAVCRLGVRTTTADAEGEVVQTRPVTSLDRQRMESILENFRGSIEQIPPMYSALKHKGQPLYKLARQGIEIERKPRTIQIYLLKLLSLQGADMEILVHCSRGTYIRTLVEDIGEALGCGAHVSALRRTGVGPYTDEREWLTLEQLEQHAAGGLEALDSLLKPVESALVELPDVRLSVDAAYYLSKGQPVQVPHAPTQGWVRIYANSGAFMGMGQILDDGRVAPRRLVNVI